MKNALTGAVISLFVSVIVLNVFNVSFHDLLSLNAWVLAVAVSLNVVRFLAQGLRLYLLLKRFSTVSIGFHEAVILRGASEFFALTTLPFMADEAVRTWLLTERGEQPAKAFWIAFVEMLLDIMVGASIAFAAGLYALTTNVYLGLTILLISAFQLALTAVFILVVRNRGGVRFLGSLPLPSRLRSWVLKSLGDMGLVYGGLFSRGTARTAAWLLISTSIVMVGPALQLYQMLGYSGLHGFSASLFTFHAGNALGVLPLTVGGAGLTEAGVYLYLREVYGIDSAATAVQWRLATYHLSLIISGILLAVTIGKMRRSEPSKTPS